MNIGIISVRDHQYHPNKRLIEAGRQLGHPVDLLHPYHTWPVLMEGRKRFIGERAVDLPDVVLPRQGAEIGDACLSLIRHLTFSGIPVLNTAEAIIRSRNQFVSLQTLDSVGIPFPDTVFINAVKGFDEAVETLGGFPVVVKQVRGRQGSGIVLVRDPADAEEVVFPHLDRYFGLLVQRFIPPSERTDIRILVIGGKIAGAMALAPAEGDFRANYHIAGKGEAVALSSEQQRAAIASVDAIGLEIAGVDMMVSAGGIQVVEVNDSPGFRGLEAVTGTDIARQIIQHALDQVQR